MSQPTLWRQARLATCDAAMSVIEQGALVTRAGQHRVGRRGVLAAGGAARDPHCEVHDLGGAWVTPGLIDCHTHLVFAGTRAGEYAQRLRGASYAEIARNGGGILSTMRAVRAASEQQLLDESAPRLKALLAEGVTTVEIKSGYGLTLADEGKMLRVARALEREFPVTVQTTSAGRSCRAAGIPGPPRCLYRYDRRAIGCRRCTRRARRCGGCVLRDASASASRSRERLFDAAHGLGLPVKMHAEQLSRIRRRRGWRPGIARSRAITWNMRPQRTHARSPRREASPCCCRSRSTASPTRASRRCRPCAKPESRMAVATDCNPGSAPGTSLLLAMSMATRLFGLTAEEALAGVTRHAARALGMQGCAASWLRARPPTS